MDVLSDVLRQLTVRGSVTGRVTMGAPWAIATPKSDMGRFHLIVRGTVVLRMKTQTLVLGPGDLVVFPHGTPHTLADARRRKVVPLFEVAGNSDVAWSTDGACRQIEAGGDGPQTTFVCGGFNFAGGEAHPLLEVLPEIMPLRAEDSRAPAGLEASVRFLADEARSNAPGAQIAIDRVLDLLFVQAVRAWMTTNQSRDIGWLGALSDPKIGAALSHIHALPAKTWTVDALAQAVGMSRSGFAARFSNMVGHPPLGYLKGWRMTLASQRMREEYDAPIAEIARSVGYETEAAFGAVFKKYFDSPPGRWRRQQRVESQQMPL